MYRVDIPQFAAILSRREERWLSEERRLRRAQSVMVSGSKVGKTSTDLGGGVGVGGSVGGVGSLSQTAGASASGTAGGLGGSLLGGKKGSGKSMLGGGGRARIKMIEGLSTEMHRRGLNVRHMGHVRAAGLYSHSFYFPALIHVVLFLILFLFWFLLVVLQFIFVVDDEFRFVPFFPFRSPCILRLF